jgi:formylglycine-generating enzyme required for sulfatase activity
MRQVIACFAFGMIFIFLIADTDAAPRKVAFLVGVSRYEKKGLNDLNYPESDVRALADELKTDGFEVKVMLGSSTGTDQANLANLKTELMEKFVPSLGKLNKQDISLVILSGHGEQAMVSRDGQRNEDVFYCPVDALAPNPQTMLSIGDLMDGMANSSGAENNLLVVDACRDNQGKGKGIDGKQVRIASTNLGVLFAASAGTTAFESNDLHSGLLAHFLLKGLQGAETDREGNVTWDILVAYVRNGVSDYAENVMKQSQLPNSISNLAGRPPVLCRVRPKVTRSPDLLRVPFTRQEAQDKQAEWAKFRGKPAEFTNAIGMHMRLIPAGEFEMGSNESLPAGDQTPHHVRITRPFYADIHETTLGEFKAFVAATKYRTTVEQTGNTSVRGWLSESRRFGQSKKGFSWKQTGWNQTDDHPVVNVSWHDAQHFAEWLSKREGRTYRLLTEAEWEYCCRAGTSTKYYPGDDPSSLTSVGNVLDRTGMSVFGSDRAFMASNQNLAIDGDDHYVFTAPVGSYPANAFGLHDMHGNVCEWCSDYFSIDYQALGPNDPQGPISGEEHSARGGRFDTGEELAKSYYRNHGAANMSDMILGIRIAADLEP